jgi:hypothetical protein
MAEICLGKLVRGIIRQTALGIHNSLYPHNMLPNYVLRLDYAELRKFGEGHIPLTEDVILYHEYQRLW